ncbi:hypothetical protein A3B51_03265 [Candidatus Curtissbacteria bacterium RIFCSPLOWO2_01_FULL_41_18]|uniref:Uncharacterized protein n=2 Tax=Candidatus Curtissiibacteriota TaxID=1752717 RepID=A0A1F5G1V6_9BACT|nr:MAG: hypothetical protein A2696_03525 [Candidatus Curtissbacteria bacterium RIFCSPHIGHO2_01_FULL_41_13]OGE04779.1 MAG: hypothetical protein A3B51_03265 [Candidatus Curtissbacteria bacterium RIFCSPLOWO2_01_FULL_41_18]
MVEFSNRGLANILILVGLGAAVIILAVLVIGGLSNKTPVQPTNPPKASTYLPSPTSQELKVFQSKSLKFEVKIPIQFQVDDNVVSVVLNSSEGQITIGRNGTNFDNLQDYLKGFDSKRRIEISGTTMLIINGLNSLSRIIKFSEEGIIQKSYYIYVNNSVYILSTKSESLYLALDQIAQSFRYTP